MTPADLLFTRDRGRILVLAPLPHSGTATGEIHRTPLGAMAVWTSTPDCATLPDELMVRCAFEAWQTEEQ